MRCIIIILAFLFPFFSWGQSLNQDTFAFSVDVDDVVITSQYEPTHYKKALHHVSVIKKEEFAQRGFTQLDQALTLHPSIRVEIDPVFGSTIKIRGVNTNNVAVLKDGVPVIGRLDGALDLSQINLADVERIELVEGPQSVLYGNNASGGVINLISKKSQVSDYNLNIKNLGEYRGVRNHQANLGINLGKCFMSVGGSFLKDKMFPDDSLRIFDLVDINDTTQLRRKRYPINPKEMWTGRGQFRYNINDQNYIIASLNSAKEEVLNLGEKLRPTFLPYSFDEIYKTTRNDYAIHYQGKLQSYLVNISGAFNDYDRLLDSRRFEFDLDEYDDSFTEVDTSSFDAYFSKFTLASTYDKKVNFLGGFQFNHEIGRGARLDGETEEGNPSSTEASVFLDVKLNPFKALTFSLSGRYTNHSVYGSNFSPALQSKWQINNNWILRAGYARGFRSPSLKELYLSFIDVNHFVVGNRDLIPETADDYSLSIFYDQGKKRSNLSASVKLYRNDITNRIILSEFESLKFTYQNLKEYSVQGINGDVNYKIGNITLQGSLGLGYWLNDIYETTETPKYNATWDSSNKIMYDSRRYGLSLSLVHRYIGAVPTYYTQNDVLTLSIAKGYNLLDVSASKMIWKNRIQLVGGIKNIFNVVFREINNLDPNANHAFNGNTNNTLVARGRSYFISIAFNLSGSF